jgi:hypothetical protein
MRTITLGSGSPHDPSDAEVGDLGVETVPAASVNP